jgi:3-oxoacyl-[acyl-carrier protein] reductase
VLLQGKNAVVYGAGSIGGAVTKAFAREGARVFVASRGRESLDRLASDVGGIETAVVDALDPAAVDGHADAIVREAGSIDVSFNVISHGDVQGTPFHEMELEDYVRPVETAVRSFFLTARAAARQMVRQRSGVILVFGGEGDPMRDYYLGGLQTAFHAMEAMRRQLAAELGPHGVRTVTLRSGGVPESIPEGFERRAEITEMLEAATMLGRTATFEDVGNIAAFVASDHARTMTAATVNTSCGALID